MGKKGGGRVRVKQMGPKGMGAPVNRVELNNIAPEDQIVFPPRPDSGVTHVWPMSATFTLNYKEGFSSIWPTYLDSTKTTRHGRRIAVADAVPEPTVLDISEALQTMGIKHAIQPYKGLPADTKSRWDNPGRVLIDMEEAAEKIGSGCGGGASSGAGASSSSSEGFDADAVPDMDGVLGGDSNKSCVEGNAKKALIREIARIIPTLPGRVQRLEAKKKQKELEDKKDKERAAKMVAAKSGGGGGAGGGGGSGTGGGSSKKKGKKKRRIEIVEKSSCSRCYRYRGATCRSRNSCKYRYFEYNMYM